MAISAALLFFFGLLAGATAVVARALRRPLGRAEMALFVALPIAFLFPGFFGGRTILPVDHAMLLAPWSHVGAGPRYNANLNDAATQMAPWAKAVRMAWKEGSLPLRDKWNGSGMALAANGQSAAFSPFTILMFPIPLWAAFTLQLGAKLLLALTGADLWLRELSVSRAAAAFGALLFAFSFTMIPWLFFPHSAVISLLPWLLFGIERMREPAVRGRATLLAGTILFVWPLCGHPESVVISASFTVLWLAVRFAAGGLPDALRLAGRLAIATGAAVGLSAFATIPQAIAIGASNRIRVAEAFRLALPSTLHPHIPYWMGGFLTSLFPRSLGDAIDSPMIAGGAGPFPEMALGFFGIVGAVCVLLFLRPGSRRPIAEKALVAPLLIGLAAATGSWPVFDFALRTPAIRWMSVLRFLSWVSFAGPALAAFEADRLARDLRSRPRTALVPLGFCTAVGVLALATYRRLAPLHAAAGGLESQKHALVATAFALACVAAISLAAAVRPRLVSVVPALLAAAAAGELLHQGMRLYQFESPERLYPETPLIRFLRSRPGPFRIMGEGAVFFPNSNVFAGLEDIRTHDPVERKDYVDFLDHAAGYPPFDYFKRLQNFNAPALDLLNVAYLAGEPGWAAPGPKWTRVYDGSDGVVFQNATPLPRVFDVDRIPVQARDRANRFTVTGYSEKTNEAFFRARVPVETGPVGVVVAMVQDGGWSVRDEANREIPTRRAERLLVSFDLPPGDHEVVMRYRPPGFAAGGAISAATALLLAAAATASIRKRRRRPRHVGSPEAPAAAEPPAALPLPRHNGAPR